jgi:F-type H+-transporting ATPase subunit gamma
MLSIVQRSRLLVAPSAQVAAQAVASQSATVPARGMAVNLSELKGRIRATKNVAKLTGVMKLVASSKLRAAEIRLAAAKPFGASLMNSVALTDAQLAEVEANTEGGAAGKKQLIVTVSTDRGLCGGVNSSLARGVKPYVDAQQAKGYDVSLITLGEKGRAQIMKDMSSIGVMALDQGFDKEPIFNLSAKLGEILADQQFDVLTVVYNEYINSSKFEQKKVHFPQLAGFAVGKLPSTFTGYSVEPENNEEALVNLMEFSLAGALHYILLESQCTEISQRVLAMDGASTNSEELAEKMLKKYNAARKDAITTSLSEIVAGVAATEDEAQ